MDDGERELVLCDPLALHRGFEIRVVLERLHALLGELQIRAGIHDLIKVPNFPSGFSIRLQTTQCMAPKIREPCGPSKE